MIQFLLLFTAPLWAAPKLKPGQYVQKNANGYLVLKPAKAGDFSFSIEAFGANGHMCGAEGTLKANEIEAKLEAMEKSDPCVLKFIPAGNIITLEASEACRYFCGARASLGGDHELAPSKCEREVITKRHEEFTALYRKKKYEDARKKLSTLREECADFISENLEDQMRNDLAVTFHHLKDDASCLTILEPLRKYAEMTDDQIKEEWVSPVEVESIIATAKATRTNLKLCKGGKK